MKKNNTTHTTNYFDTFIEVAADCPLEAGEVPPIKGNKRSVADLQFELIMKNPYRFTSDDVLFQVFAERKDLAPEEYPEARQQFFSKGQPCLRCSPLSKRYGWGIHSDADGKIALYGMESETYQNFIDNPNIKKVKAMRSSRK